MKINANHILNILFGDTRGWYVDVGCGTGVGEENLTGIFAKTGWRGVCIDADTKSLNACKRKRGTDDVTYVKAAAVGRVFPDETAVFYWEGTVKFSGLIPQEEMAKRWYHAKERAWRGYRQRTVPAMKLNDILAKTQIDVLHLLVISTNGTEQDVLSGLDLGLWKPRIIAVDVGEAEASITLYLRSMGYYTLFKGDKWTLFSNDYNHKRTVDLKLGEIGGDENPHS
jgi:FkbM family methyltransferase